MARRSIYPYRRTSGSGPGLDNRRKKLASAAKSEKLRPKLAITHSSNAKFFHHTLITRKKAVSHIHHTQKNVRHTPLR